MAHAQAAGSGATPTRTLHLAWPPGERCDRLAAEAEADGVGGSACMAPKIVLQGPSKPTGTETFLFRVPSRMWHQTQALVLPKVGVYLSTSLPGSVNHAGSPSIW